MHRIEVRARLEPADIAAVQRLFAAAEAVDGQPPVDEPEWLELVRHGQPDPFAGLVAWTGTEPHAVGYAQVARSGSTWALQVVVDPEYRTPAHTVGPDLATAARRTVASLGGGEVHFWVSRPRYSDDQLAVAVGLRPWRALYQMRRALPVEDARIHGAIQTRPFRPGVDEQAWLDVNNRAFSWHPEQGGWDLGMVEAHERQPWFDPEGFLMYEEDGVLAGFCWTKIHSGVDPPLGEIYVIAVNPDFGRRGLGRRLTVAGLDHLFRAGLEVGMLYVDATNESAVKLYVDLGFTVHHVDQSYIGDVDPA